MTVTLKIGTGGYIFTSGDKSEVISSEFKGRVLPTEGEGEDE